MIEFMLTCYLFKQSIVEEFGQRDRLCEYRCQKQIKESVYTDPQYQCPKKLYIEDPDRNRWRLIVPSDKR